METAQKAVVKQSGIFLQCAIVTLGSFLLFFKIILMGGNPVAGGPLEDGQAAYRRGDYPKALNLWKPLAMKGDATAQRFLGAMYVRGEGVPQDYAEALKWLRQAADQGEPIAQDILSRMNFHSAGVPKDAIEAYKWANLAASRLPPGKDHDDVVFRRNLYAKGLTAEQVEEAQKRAREWKPK